VTDSISAPVPPRRHDDLVVREQGAETLVLDTRTDTVHCLPAGTARVWAACTPGRTVGEVMSAAGLDQATVSAAIAELADRDLLATPAGIDRRWFLRRSVLVGAGVAAAPIVIQSVVAPTAAAAASPVVTSVTLTQTGCGTGSSQKLQFTVTINGTANSTFFPTVTAPWNETQPTTTAVTTNGSGTGTGTGQFSPHSGGGNFVVRVYSDAAHTHLIFTSAGIPLTGC
jgi:hypothetical protein